MAKAQAFPTLLSVTCFLRNETDILLMQRAANRTHEPSKWSGVGGKLHGSETVLDAAMRETQEETGQSIPAEHFRFRGTLIMDGYPEGRWVVSLFEVWTDDRDVVQTAEGQLHWVPIDEVRSKDLMDDIHHYIEHMIHETEPIFGYFRFDEQAKVVEQRLTSAETAPVVVG